MGAEAPSIIEMEAVEKRYESGLCFREEARALRGLSMEVKTGSVTCLVGKNGSGKSTLTRLLIGAEMPSKGVIRYNGQKLWRSGVMNDLGYSPDGGLWKYVTVLEHLFLYASLKGILEEQIAK